MMPLPWLNKDWNGH